MTAILPGSILGVLGGGQLGRMFTLAARRMGYRIHVLAPADDTPAGQIADREIRAEYDDLEAVERFAAGVEVVTFEFENVPTTTTEAAARQAPVRPDGSLLHTTQNRIREKTALRRLHAPLPPHAFIRNDSDLETALSEVGTDGVLKTAAWGYDGKGQRRVRSRAELERGWQELGTTECVFEAWVPFEREISVIGARHLGGELTVYEPFENRHSNHVLDLTVWPADVPPELNARAKDLACSILESLDVVGVLCVEMFVLPDGEVLVNELAPRPHNSGHLTIDACETNQFELQVRAVCGLPPGSVSPRAPAAAMANLLGDLWQDGTPDWSAALSEPGVSLHLYGKDDARPGRKMGHLTATAATREEAADRVQRARQRLCQSS